MEESFVQLKKRTETKHISQRIMLRKIFSALFMIEILAERL